MSREILLLVDALASEKNVNREVVFSALEMALASATKKKFNEDELDVRVEIDRHNGQYQTFRRWTVVDAEALEYEDRELSLEEARERDPRAERDRRTDGSSRVRPYRCPGCQTSDPAEDP